MMATGHRMQGSQHTHDQRSLPSRERCHEVLRESNRDTPRWTCPVCGESASRSHWIAEHVIHHLDYPNGDT